MGDLTSKAKIIITYAKTYDMPSENGREARRGTTVHYFFYGENGSGFKAVTSDKVNDPVGYQRAKVSLDYEKRSKIPTAPGVYDGTFEMKLGADGKPVLNLVDVDYLFPLELAVKKDVK